MASFTGCAYTNGVMQSALDSSEIDANTLTAQAGGNLSALASLEDMGDAYSTPEGYQNLQDKGLSTTQQILKTAYSQMGKPYKYGGTSPQTGFDCAGFVQWCYQQSGIDLPRTSKEMLSVGSPVDKDDLRPGDILVYGSYRGRGVTHAGIYIGNGRYIHSPNTGDRIKESEAFDKYHRAHFIAARRVLNEPGATPLADQHKEQLVAKALAENANLAVKQSKSNSKSNKSDGGFVYYQVKKGDVPSAIARRYKISTDKLLAANGLGPKKVLKVGQKLKIPGQSTTTTTATAESVQSRTSETKSHKKTATTQYVVKSGDVMSAIASRFNVTTKSLLQANKLTSSSKLRIGQKLTIPGAASVAETKSAGSKPMANKSYSVKSGDSLWLIAQRFGVSVSSLTKVNSLGDHELKIGQELRIP
jgi:cell wall-associated NlpC family hydrolase